MRSDDPEECAAAVEFPAQGRAYDEPAAPNDVPVPTPAWLLWGGRHSPYRTWEAGLRLLRVSRGGERERRRTHGVRSPQLDDHKVPDLLRVVDGFPPAGSGMPKHRTVARVGGLELSAT
jgi:hypothetical protein